jgi:hypothetical protein
MLRLAIAVERPQRLLQFAEKLDPVLCFWAAQRFTAAINVLFFGAGFSRCGGLRRARTVFQQTAKPQSRNTSDRSAQALRHPKISYHLRSESGASSSRLT